jgi:hypothetical protein
MNISDWEIVMTTFYSNVIHLRSLRCVSDCETCTARITLIAS